MPLLDWLIENEPAFRPSRLPSLYSDLVQQRSSNPEGYGANLTCWSAALTRAALAGQLPLEQRLILQTSDELLDALASARYGRPSGLGAVIDDCVRSGKMMDLKDFMDAEGSIYKRSWVPSPWAVAKWALRTAGILGSGSYEVGGRLRRGDLVIIPALEEAAKQVLGQRDKVGSSLTDRILSRDAFVSQVGDAIGGKLSSTDTNVLLRHLARDKGVLSYDGTTVKFAPPSGTPEPIVAEDRTIASLKSLISTLGHQVTQLESRIASLQISASTAVKTGSKTSALSALRSKKLAERTLSQRSATLSQLEEVFTKIQSAADQIEIVETLSASAGVLKSLNAKVGGVERVDEVMDALRGEMERTEEVGSVLREPLGDMASVDELEVDEELERMEREETEKTEAREKEKRIRQEEKEAEETRRRLLELDAHDAERHAKEQAQTSNEQRATSEMDVEDVLATSIEKLHHLDLAKGSQEQKHDESRQQIAEGAS